MEGGRRRERRPGSRCGPRAGPGLGLREPGPGGSLGGPLGGRRGCSVSSLAGLGAPGRPEPPAPCPPRSSSRLQTPIRSGPESRGRGSGPRRAAAARLAFLLPQPCSRPPPPPSSPVPGFCFVFGCRGFCVSPSSWVYIIMLLFCRTPRRPWRLKRRWNAFRSFLNIIK